MREGRTLAVAADSGRGQAGSGRMTGWESALTAWETVLALVPDHDNALVERLECTIHLKRWEAALAAYRAAEARLGIEDRMRIARKFASGGEHEKALWLWRRIVEQAACEEHALSAIRGQLQCFAKLGLTDQRPLIDRKVGPPRSSGEAPRRYRPRSANRDPRHVAILGVSYCGSTLLSLVLGALSGVANVGESHWLLEPRADKPRSTEEPTPVFEQCVWCGVDCPVLTNELRRRLADNPDAFFQILAEAQEADIIVTADKNYPHVVRRDPDLHNDALIVFREPLRNWQSHARRSNRTDEVARRRYLENWAIAYTNFLDNFPNTGTKVLVDFDRFLADPEDGLRYLCSALDLPFTTDALRYWQTRQHCVGGNREVRERLANEDARDLAIRPQPEAHAEASSFTDSALPSEVLLVYQRLQRHASRSSAML